MLKRIVISTLLLGFCATAAAEPKQVTIKDFEYTNKYELALRKAQHDDKGKAFETLLEYAKYGEKIAQYMVANFYLAGLGTEPNAMEGLVWMGVALEQRVPEWQKSYEALTAKLTPEQKTMVEEQVQQRIALYGARAQKMNCSIDAAVTGSNMRYHVCTKIRDGAQRVTVVKYDN